MKARGLLEPGAVRRVAIVGPGLDFADKDVGFDFYPQQTLQPFAVLDSLKRLGLAPSPGDPEIVLLDISPRVIDHVTQARARAVEDIGYTLNLPLPRSDAVAPRGSQILADVRRSDWRAGAGAVVEGDCGSGRAAGRPGEAVCRSADVGAECEHRDRATRRGSVRSGDCHQRVHLLRRARAGAGDVERRSDAEAGRVSAGERLGAESDVAHDSPGRYDDDALRRAPSTRTSSISSSGTERTQNERVDSISPMVAALSRGYLRGLLALALFGASCSVRPSPGGAEHKNEAQAGAPTARTLRGGVEEWFTDRARESGLDFVHFNGMTGQFYFPEVIPPGVALLDYDGDGDLDVFVRAGTDARKEGAQRGAVPAARPPDESPLPQRPRGSRRRYAHAALYRRHRCQRHRGARVRHGRRNRRLRQRRLRRSVCDQPRTEPAVPQQLRRNVYRRVEARAAPRIAGGASRRRSSITTETGGSICLSGTTCTTASKADKPCLHSIGSLRDYCPPSVYRPQPDRLYHNNRNGTFTDVTAAAGMGREFGPALGVSTADFNGDGWIDIYVANDGAPNQLWINRHDGTFTNTALARGRRARR